MQDSKRSCKFTFENLRIIRILFEILNALRGGMIIERNHAFENAWRWTNLEEKSINTKFIWKVVTKASIIKSKEVM